MRYGFCTGLASPTMEAVDYELLERIKKAGYDYAEFPLMLLERLSDSQFDFLLGELDRLQLGCDCCCDMFPKSIRIVGPGVNSTIIGSYLQRIFSRATSIGTKKIVLGSVSSRNLPDGYTTEEGYGQLTALIVSRILPLCVKHGISIVIEPIRSAVCNFINTLPEGMALVHRVDSPHVTLMADSIHMLSEHEDPNHICQYISSLDHVHISEMGRGLPEDSFSLGIQRILECLKMVGYDKTISFETKPGNIGKALALLKGAFA
jgi:D-psicose/D-tagatose/L-ribulose 3-epimerase